MKVGSLNPDLESESVGKGGGHWLFKKSKFF